MSSISDTAYFFNPNDNKFHPLDLSTEKTLEDTGWNATVIPISKSANSISDETNENSNYYEIMGFCSPATKNSSSDTSSARQEITAKSEKQKSETKAEIAKDPQDAANTVVSNTTANENFEKTKNKKGPGIVSMVKSFFSCETKVTNKTDEK